MDRVSVIAVRAALVWLVIGVVLGVVMISDELLPGRWRVWFAPTHGHILLVGWFLQFAVAIAYWLLPRKRTPELPLGYREAIATAAFALLNAGLLVRVIAEPASRMGQLGGATSYLLALSGGGQLIAIAIVTYHLWGRTIPRPRRDGAEGRVAPRDEGGPPRSGHRWGRSP